MKKKHLIAFPYFGGKNSHLSWLLPIVNAVPHTGFVDVFGGSAAVVLNKDPANDTYNDLDGECVTFFRCLRCRSAQLIEQLTLTPYSREEFARCLEPFADSEVERARRFFVKLRQARGGFPFTPASWRYSSGRTRRGTGEDVAKWLSGVDGLADVVERLRQIKIECLPAVDIIPRYDSPEVLFYLDPPYYPDTRSNNGSNGYKHEMTAEDHKALLSVLLPVNGKVLLSGYDNNLYRDTLRGWCFHSVPTYCRSQSGVSRNNRTECLWANFQMPVQKQFSFSEGGEE